MMIIQETTTLTGTNSLQSAPELQELQYLMPIDSQDRENLKNDIEESQQIRDPLKCYIDKNTGILNILGGYNRWCIAKELNIETVPIQIVEGDTEEYKDFVIKDNLNRRHLSREQKNNLIAFLLKNHPEQSNRTAGKRVGVDHKTVQSVREKLESSGEIPHLNERIGQDWRIQRSSKKESVKLKNKVELLNFTLDNEDIKNMLSVIDIVLNNNAILNKLKNKEVNLFKKIEKICNEFK